MSYIESILLGIVQGITEFLPISSSGHLLIGRSLFDIKISDSGSFFEIFLHGGTLLSILFYWKNDLIKNIRKTMRGDPNLFFNIILGTIPAAIVGLLFKDKIDDYFFDVQNISYLSLSYLFLAVILFSTKNKHKNVDAYDTILYKFAFLIGIAQCFAIIPGISRSGMTIAIAIFLGINKKVATNFSFMLAIPILSFSFIGSLIDNLYLLNNNFWVLVLGFLSSFITGYFVIDLLVRIIENQRLWYFSIYCLFISIVLGSYYGL
jgi:undecaprenyl-diphosphatase